MDSLLIIIVALVAVFIAWKVLKGIVKTLALVAILIVAAIFVFGVL
ncbi:hypothetical protein [Croceicoccus gelatinilyticus]|nr:hypothetical protein [Croceicoccus gelatinilyticus]MBS7668640.1 hypothetical protein [Croceicoccus gelatinilyticus]